MIPTDDGFCGQVSGINWLRAWCTMHTKAVGPGSYFLLRLDAVWGKAACMRQLDHTSDHPLYGAFYETNAAALVTSSTCIK